MFRIAMLSRWHAHGRDNRYVKELAVIPDTKITCVWDEIPERGEKWANELGAGFEPSLEKLLARTDVDGVCITAPTNMHKDLIIKAARAGKHVFTEKTLALSVEDAYEVKRTIDETGVKFCIAFLRRSNPEFAYGKKLYDEGALGEITFMRVRNGYPVEGVKGLPDYWFCKEQTGGGAMMDLGCHPIYLAFWILGEPVSVSSTFTLIGNREVEDGAVCNIKFKNKAIAMVESTYNAPVISTYTFEIYGMKGTYLVGPDAGVVRLKKYGCKMETIRVEDLPQGPKTPMNQWVDACTKGGDITCDVNEGVLLTRILCGAYEAHQENRTVEL